jgi:hypothetical protein
MAVREPSLFDSATDIYTQRAVSGHLRRNPGLYPHGGFLKEPRVIDPHSRDWKMQAPPAERAETSSGQARRHIRGSRDMVVVDVFEADGSKTSFHHAVDGRHAKKELPLCSQHAANLGERSRVIVNVLKDREAHYEVERPTGVRKLAHIGSLERRLVSSTGEHRSSGRRVRIEIDPMQHCPRRRERKEDGPSAISDFEHAIERLGPEKLQAHVDPLTKESADQRSPVILDWVSCSRRGESLDHRRSYLGHRVAEYLPGLLSSSTVL